jgi:hypothetical protein
MKTTLYSRLLTKLKLELSDFCGLLSVSEIASNVILVRCIERLERMLLSAGA